MGSLRSVARSLIEEEGSIGYIIDLLEDPEDAKYNLKPEIDQVRETAGDCLKNAEAITKKFEYWHRVIIHLKQTSLSRRGVYYLNFSCMVMSKEALALFKNNSPLFKTTCVLH